ncbi:hypothetical protein E2C01_090751 [Portunus trituberculatus]|uniref:Uncharacterized protein n=1 Tax=Portunus trituberculatus TaxID=210409 RepID=A0A5B7JLQ8_PORTR|nr:hypothetical protein [Portunus trituberculatus]
MDKIRGRK